MAKSEWRIYKTEAARKSALAQILAHGEFNYIVVYKDAAGPALNLANVAWLGPNQIYLDG